MLHFCIGESGSGKSTYLYEQIKEASKNVDNRIILLIPDQYSFESEKRLYESEIENFNNINVFTFEKLSGDILSQSEEVYSKNTDSRIRLLTMALAVKEVSDALSIYANQISHVSFYMDMLELIKEFKTNGVSPYDFENTYENLDENTILKAKDISLIYSSYEALLEEQSIPSSSENEIAAKKSEEISYFKDKVVFIDEFYVFSADKYKLLEAMIKDAKEIYISLCLSKTNSVQKQLFSASYATYSKLKRLCEDNFCDYEENLNFDNFKRFKNEALVHFSKNIFNNKINSFNSENNGISAVRASDMYSECDYVCAQIRQLVINDGYRYKDIAIVGRNTAEYTNALEASLVKYEIPAFFDTREAVLKKASAVLCVSAFEITTFNTENILKFLKTGYTDIPLEEIAELENYCYVWDINGALWLEDFSYHEEYKNDNQKSQNEKLLERLNIIRRRLVFAINKFKADTENTDGAGICNALYKFITEIGITKKLNENIDELIDENNETEARQLSQIWDIIVDTLEVMYKLLKNRNLSRKEFAELFRQILSESSFAIPPQHIDEVTVGNAGNIRLSEPKVVFLIGVNEGVFPMSLSNGLLFSAYERKKINEQGIEIYFPDNKEFWKERFMFYKAATAPSEKLYLTYSDKNAEYISLYPAVPINQCIKMFGSEVLKNANDFDEMFYCSSKSALFERYAKFYFDNTETQSAKRLAMQKNCNMSEDEKLLENASKNIEFSINNKEVMDKLTGKNVYLSATRIEQYYQCRFAHFCRYGLDLKPLQKMDVNAAEMGKVLHYCMERILKEYFKDLKEFDRNKTKALAKQIINEYIEEKCGGIKDKTNRYKNLMGRLANRITTIIEQIKAEFEQSEFVPCDFELEISDSGKIKPLVLTTKDGKNITLCGVVDRADIYEKDGVKYVRIVDYKSNGKKLDLNMVYEGLNLQMLLYLFIVAMSKEGEYANVSPAGILYYSMIYPKGNEKRNKTAEEKENVLRSAYKMNGLILNDETVINAMEKGGAGIFIPKYDKRNASSFATAEELGKLKAYCESLLIRMIDEYSNGKINTTPIEISSQKNSCTYCPYSEICGKKDEIELRTSHKFTSGEFYNTIEEQVSK